MATNSSEDFVDWKVHECYLWFGKFVRESDPDVEEYLNNFFGPTFANMLEVRPDTVWRRRGDWVPLQDRNLR